jgi:peptidoglycan/LPS O-acetylase OafA/YrhL
VLLLLIVTPLSLALGRTTAWHDALIGVLYIGNWDRAMGNWVGDLSHLWSLAIEEQFYLVWPIVLLLLRPRVRWLIAAAVAVALGRLLVTPDMAIFGTFGRADALLLGGAIALAGVRFPAWSAWAGLAFVALIGVLQPDDTGMAAYGLTLASMAGVLLVGGLAERPSMFLERRAPRTIGRISYGVYLWDYPLVSLFGPLAGSLGCVAMAAASYRLVELPFLRLKDGGGLRRRTVSQQVEVTAIGQRLKADLGLLDGRYVRRVANQPPNGPDLAGTSVRVADTSSR